MGCGAMSSVPLLSTLLNLKLANTSAAANLNPFQQADGDVKTLVCLFMLGGNDSFNLLIPQDEPRHQEYQASRSNLALDLETLHALDQADGGDDQLYALHPNCQKMQELFNGMGGDPDKRRLAFIANIGTLVEPITVQQFINEDPSVRIPLAIGSHEDQSIQWQTSVPQGMESLSGWGGRAADILHSVYNQDNLSMGISVGRSNLFQVGNQADQFVVGEGGASQFTTGVGEFSPANVKNAITNSLLEEHYSNLIDQTFRDVTRFSKDQSEFYQNAYNNFDDSDLAIPFPGTPVGSKLRTAFAAIVLREQLGLRRQTLYILDGDFDTHLNLLATQAKWMEMYSEGIYAFQSALDQYGLQDSVISFGASDFGRTLRSNGRGTDHAWGGNTFVFGGPVNGGRVYGTFPSLAIEGPDDVGTGGQLLPTTSIDQLFAEMLQWFGVSNTDLPYVLPNIENFYNIGSNPPIGFLKS